MPGQRKPGMDHEHYAWSPIPSRPPLRWPNGARVALATVVVLEHMEYQPPPGSHHSPLLAFWRAPNYTWFSQREYGHRVGVFRVLDLLERLGLKPTVAMDAATAQHYPYLVRHIVQRGCEVIAHGAALTQMVTSKMSEEEERAYIKASVDAVARAVGKAPQGWLGPDYGESHRTPRLLAEAGLRYVCDWHNDEQPYPMTVPSGNLTALPVLYDLDDSIALWERQMPVDQYRDMLGDAFDQLYRDGAQSGRVLTLALHPWLIGQPFRVPYLEEALELMVRRQGVWAATGAEIVDWYTTHAAGR